MQFAPIDQSLLMPNKLDASIKQGADIYSTILNMLVAPEIMKTQRAAAQESLKQQQLKNQYYPLNTLIEASRAQNQADAIANSKSRFGASYLFSKNFANLPVAQRKQYFAQYPGSYEMLMAAQGNQAMKEALIKADNSGSSASDPYSNAIHDQLVTLGALPEPNNDEDENASNQDTSEMNSPQTQQPNIVNSAIPQSPANPQATPPPPINPQAQITPQQAQLLQKIGLGQPGGPKIPLQAAQPINQDMPPALAPAQQTSAQDPNAPYSGDTSFTPTNAQVQSAGDSAKMDANRSLNSATLNNRIDQGEAIGHLFEQPQVLKSLATLTKYSGVEGKAKLAWARVMHPKEYLQYQTAADQLGTIISGSLKGIENIPTSNEGMRTGKEYINKAAALATGKGDPAAVADYLVNGIDLVMAEQNALLKTGQKAFPDQIPQHQKVRTMLDDVAEGKNPNEVLALYKNPKTNQVSMQVEGSNGNRVLTSKNENSYSNNDIGYDKDGRQMIRNKRTGKYYYVDQLGASK